MWPFKKKVVPEPTPEPEPTAEEIEANDCFDPTISDEYRLIESIADGQTGVWSGKIVIYDSCEIRQMKRLALAVKRGDSKAIHLISNSDNRPRLFREHLPVECIKSLNLIDHQLPMTSYEDERCVFELEYDLDKRHGMQRAHFIRDKANLGIGSYGDRNGA